MTQAESPTVTNMSCTSFSLQRGVLTGWAGKQFSSSMGMPSTLKSWMWPCLSILSWGISYVHWSWKPDFFLLNHAHVSLRYYEMGFLPMLKETADVSVPLWYEKFNLEGWEKEWCTAYFHSPTPRDMRMMFYCVEEMMPIVLRRNSFIIQFNFSQIPMAGSSAEEWQNDGDEEGGLETKMERGATQDWDWNNGGMERVAESGQTCWKVRGGDSDTKWRGSG